MSVFSRRNKSHLGDVDGAVVGDNGLSILKDSPLSSHYQPPSGNNPKQVVLFLLATQKRCYGETVEETVPLSGLTSHVNSLMTKGWTSYQLKRGITLASWQSEYPFSFKYVLVCLEELGEKPDAEVGVQSNNRTLLHDEQSTDGKLW